MARREKGRKGRSPEPTWPGASRAEAEAPAPPAAVALPRPPRRRVLACIWGILTAALTLELFWILGSFLRPRRRTPASGVELTIAGPVSRFAPGSVTAFPEGRFYLARLENGGFLALDRTCTHLGCTLPWNAVTGRFDCPCHASSFDIAGEVLAPPAPRPLDLYPVRIENGVVKVDTSRRVRRARFETSQVARG